MLGNNFIKGRYALKLIQNIGAKMVLYEIDRDAPIDQPVLGIGRFFGDQPVSLTSCRFRDYPFIARGAGNDITATRTLAFWNQLTL